MKFFKCTLTALMLLTTFALTAQTVVRGVVTSAEDGEPLIGVNILVKGTSVGAATDLDGKFEIQANPATDVLSISYTGYNSIDVKLNGQTNVAIQLELAAALLNEVIVTAFGESTREKFTGSAAVVGAEQIAKRPITNITQAIAGSGPGI
jgi:hypothetical protein